MQRIFAEDKLTQDNSVKLTEKLKQIIASPRQAYG